MDMIQRINTTLIKLRVSFLIVSIIILVSGCYTPHPVPFHVSPNDSAALRVSRVANVWIDANSKCMHKKSVPLNLNGGVSTLDKNTVIGMPTTDDDFPTKFHEYNIPVNNPVTITMEFVTANHVSETHCGPISTSFTPEVGAMYDAQMRFKGRACFIVIRKLSKMPSAPNKAVAEIIKTNPAYSCLED
jgi:hypothetical protein